MFFFILCCELKLRDKSGGLDWVIMRSRSDVCDRHYLGARNRYMGKIGTNRMVIRCRL